MAAAKRWTCLEAGCGRELRAADLDELVAAAQRHMAEAHASVELEDVIEAAAEDVPADTSATGR